MDPPFSGFVLDPSKCRNLSIEKKRELIRELSNWPEGAPEKLQTWSRRDLLEILCAEMGKERKYTGVTKQKLIENIFRIVSAKKSGEHIEDLDSNRHPPRPPPDPQVPSKRQRKADHPSRLLVATDNLLVNNNSEDQKIARYCLNLACRATLNREDAFCKRCSCCICHKYDDNKDPSLWLVCSSENPYEGDPCGLSCHLECALKNERSGISENGKCARLDGSYYCLYCGKVNDLLRCWRKQLVIAKDARRVDILCYRVSLSHKLLRFSEKYQSLHAIVDSAMKKLESEVGPLNGLPNLARGIVNRLSVGAEVQRLCVCALESLDSILSSASPFDAQIHKARLVSTNLIKFEGISPTSVTVVLGLEDHPSLSQELVGYTLWHRKADTTDYSTEPTCTLRKAKRRFLVTDLTPSTEYIFKLIAFSNARELEKWEVGVKTEAILKGVSNSLVAEGTSPKLCCASLETNSSGLSNPSFKGDDANACHDLNKSPHSFLDSGKSSDHAYSDTNGSRNASIVTTSTTEGIEQEETLGQSGSALDEEPNSTNSTEHNQEPDVRKSENESNTPIINEMVIVPYGISESAEPATPYRLETGKEGSGRSGKPKPVNNLLENGQLNPERDPGSSSKKRGGGKCQEVCIKHGSSEGTYEYCVKVIRWLECEGHIETDFRVKFLTWFSLRASPQERRVVTAYVNTLIDDPTSLAGQLMDTFSEAVCRQRPPPVATGFCMRLWH